LVINSHLGHRTGNPRDDPAVQARLRQAVEELQQR
jgi:hypothetical protein